MLQIHWATRGSWHQVPGHPTQLWTEEGSMQRLLVSISNLATSESNFSLNCGAGWIQTLGTSCFQG